MANEERYEELLQRWRASSLLATCAATLEWEQQTTLPAKAGDYRSEQLAYLAGLQHEKATDPRVGELLADLEGTKGFSDVESAEGVNVREIRRAYDRATKLPKRLVEEWAQTCSLAQQHWQQARKEKDFKQFEPWLSRVLKLAQEKAKALEPGKPVYDTMLDEYERGATTARIAGVFEALREPLVDLVAAIADSPRRAPVEILQRSYPIDRQQIFGEMAASEIGFDFSRGRLDVTTHPFCTTLGPHDCRILTRYNAHHFSESFFGILHEAGHGLYEQGLLPEHFGTPMGEAVSLGVHESQSRLWENQVGRSRAFWESCFPRAQGVFREALTEVSLDDFYFALNHVSPSFIRVEADEATYNLHVLIRFEMEQAMVGGDLPVGDVPAAWNEKYRAYLGVDPPTAAQGCLQDVHWSAGLLGYFPTYTLGNIYAAQLFAAAERDLGSVDDAIREGRFRDLLHWLREKIHRHGKRYLPAQLIEHATGEAPRPQALLDSLRSKLAPLYGL